MTTELVINDAPTASQENPASATTTPAAGAGYSEALIIACAFAGWGNPMAGFDMSPERAEHLLSWVLAEHPHEQVVRWRTRVDAAEHAVRYRWAAKTVHRLYPKRCGADSLPDELEQVADLLPAV